MNGNREQFQHQITGAPYTSLRWFNQSTVSKNFTTPGLDQIGSLGRNSLYGPNFFNMDLSVMKSFPVREVAHDSVPHGHVQRPQLHQLGLAKRS